MVRVTRLLLSLGVVIGAACTAQTSSTVFPSDGRDPKNAGGAELLEVVCPGNVSVDKDITCKGSCPKLTGFQDWVGEWTLGTITYGHFLSAGSEAAVLSMYGCEAHTENFGGTILLTRNSGKWKMLWYKPGVETSACHKVQLETGREILVCFGDYGGQGIVSTALYVEDMLAPVAALMAGDASFFNVADNVLSCGFNAEDEFKPHPVSLETIEKVEFFTDPNGQSIISVSGQKGERAMTTEDAKKCYKNAGPFIPPTQPYHVDFVLNGHDYQPAR